MANTIEDLTAEILAKRKAKQEEYDRVANESAGGEGALMGLFAGLAKNPNMLTNWQSQRQARIKALSDDNKDLDSNILKIAEFKTKQEQEARNRQQNLDDKKEYAKYVNSLPKKSKGGGLTVDPETGAIVQDSELETLAKKKQVGTMADAIAKRQAGIDELNVAVSQLENPKIPEDQKVQIGEMLLKKLNDPVFSDAVGAEEVKRLGSYLQQFSLTRAGSTFGRDIPRFTQQVKNKADLLSQTQSASQSRLGELTGKRPMATKPSASAPPPPMVPAPANEKIMNGVKWRKVPGGWEEVK